MNMFFHKVNLIPLLFISNIFALFTNNNYFSYLIIITYFAYYSNIVLKNGIKKSYVNKEYILLIYILFMIMITTTLVNIENKSNINSLIKIFIMLTTVILGFELGCIEKRRYYISGFIIINRFMMIINLCGILEFLLKYNYFINFIVDENVRGWHTWSIGTSYYRIFTVFTHPIIYANMLVIVFWINFLLEKNKKYRAINTILIIFCLYATKSRSSWIAFVITILIYYISGVRIKNKLTYRHIINSLIIILSILLLSHLNLFKDIINNIINRFTELFNNGGTESSIQRIGTINYILDTLYNQSIIKTLLGNGFGQVAKLMNKVTISIKDFTSTDNQYLSILIEFGIVGIILNIIMILRVFLKFLKSECKFEKNILILFISMSINMFFYELYGWNIILYLYLLIIGTQCINWKNINLT